MNTEKIKAKGGFSLDDVKRIFFDYSTYRNSEEMHNGGDPLEFEEWAEKFLQPREGREVKFAEWLRKNYRTHEIYGKDLPYNTWRQSPKVELFPTSELFQIFIKQNPKP